MLTTKGLLALTEHKQVSWRLIKVENYDNKNYNRNNSRIWFYYLKKLTLSQVILTLTNNHCLDP